MSEYSWFIPGQPIGKARARVYRNKYTDKSHAVTPDKTQNWEAFAVYYLRMYFKGWPIDLPLDISIVAVFDRPKRLLTKKSPTGRIYHTEEPDIDNIEKIVFDSLQRAGVIRNDSRICKLQTSKFYREMGEPVGVHIRLTTLD